MSRLRLILVAAVALATMAAGNALAADTTNGSMDTLSAYLHGHRLPLVEARMIINDSGERMVLLYGFVATEYGKRDAEDQARDFLDDPDIAIVNRIKIRPELLTLGTRQNDQNSQNAAESADSTQPNLSDNSDQTNDLPDSLGDRDDYANQERDDELLTSNGAMIGGIPLPLVLLGSGAIFPPVLNGPTWLPPSYARPPVMVPPFARPPAIVSAPPPVVVLRPFAPPAYPGFPTTPSFPSAFPAGPTPMFPATGGAPPFPGMGGFAQPGFGARGGLGTNGFGNGGGLGGGGFGGFGGGFGGHR